MGVGGADETRYGKCGVGGSGGHGWFLFSSAEPGSHVHSGRTVQSYMKERGKDIISLFRLPRVFRLISIKERDLRSQPEGMRLNGAPSILKEQQKQEKQQQ